MDGAELEALAQTGKLLLALKLFLTSSNFLWIYDYFLTLGDEIKYAWSGRKSWIFALFIANRYTPLIFLTWINITLFDYGKSFCEATKWISVFHTVAVTTLAQTAIALRIYALTGKNKLLGGSLLVLISAQLCFGVYFIARTAMSPAQSIPEIDLDAFGICFYQRWKFGELFFTNLVIAFDFVAFLMILAATRRPGMSRFPGIPSILETVLRDATVYYTFVFVCQLLVEFFLLFAPEEIQLMPGVVNTIFVPTMASRLMLSLKKAAAEPYASWSLSTMSDFGRRTTSELITIHFAPQEIPESLVPPNEGDIELEPMGWDRR